MSAEFREHTHCGVTIRVRNAINGDRVPSHALPSCSGGDDRDFLRWYCPDVADHEIERVCALLVGSRLDVEWLPSEICFALSVARSQAVAS